MIYQANLISPDPAPGVDYAHHRDTLFYSLPEAAVLGA